MPVRNNNRLYYGYCNGPIFAGQRVLAVNSGSRQKRLQCLPILCKKERAKHPGSYLRDTAVRSE